MTAREPTLTTERLTLRALELSDAPAHEALCRPIEVARNTLTMPHPYPPGGALEFIQKGIDSFAEGEKVRFAIVQRETGALLGVIGLNIDRVHSHAEVGYTLGMDYWGKGYATEAARELVRYAFDELKLHRLNAGYYARNPASGRVLIKCGFNPEGFRPQMYERFGERVDLMLVGLLREDWQKARTP